MRFKGLDLNLLFAFDVLLEERNVSRAAERMHMTQPAASAALARLREFFGDDLLVASGRQMIPTSYAQSLVPEVKRALAQVDGIISMSSEFVPAQSERQFRVMASDYIVTILLSRAVAAMRTVAPGVRFDIHQPSDRVNKEFERGEFDLLLLPEDRAAPEHPAELLLEEPHVVVGWDQNPVFDGGLTAADFFACSHVSVALGATRAAGFADGQLEAAGIRRKVATYAPTFGSVPFLLVGTDRLAVMHARLARVFTELLPLRTAPLPVPLTPMREMMQYHRARESDQGLGWLRRFLKELADEVPGIDHTEPRR
jgi:DNA-binding transcriptional LysR family regulator